MQIQTRCSNLELRTQRNSINGCQLSALIHILIPSSGYEKVMTNKEFLAAFRLSPEQLRERDLEIERDAALANESERPLVQEINAKGWGIESVWDLVNFHTDHAALVPLLLSHLPRDYHPKVKMAIARSLINVKASAALCSPVLVDELKKALQRPGGQWEGVQQSLALALRKLAHPSATAELQALASEYKGSFLSEDLEKTVKRILPKKRT